jgi:hypothetical protein
MKARYAAIAPCLLLLLMEVVGGCALLPEIRSDSRFRNPFAPRTTRSVPQNNLNPSIPNYSGQNISCLTANYYANITWNQQPYMQLGRRPSEVMLSKAASMAQDANGVVYTSQGNAINATVRFDSGGSCNIRTSSYTGVAAIDETGQIGGGGTNNTSNASYQDSYSQGYNQGYYQGYQDGRNAQQYNYGYNPNGGSQGNSYSGNSAYDRGYNAGYSRGFQDGYNSGGSYPPGPIGPVLW